MYLVHFKLGFILENEPKMVWLVQTSKFRIFRFVLNLITYLSMIRKVKMRPLFWFKESMITATVEAEEAVMKAAE